MVGQNSVYCKATRGLKVSEVMLQIIPLILLLICLLIKQGGVAEVLNSARASWKRE